MHVGLIGARSFGQNHLEGMDASRHVAAVSIAGRDGAALEALKAQFPKVRAFTTDYQELLADSSIDLISITLPHHLHLPVALAAFERGKHVLVEKPPARTPAEFQQMLDAASAAGKRLFVVMNLLFNPLHHAVRQAVDAGRIGRPFLSVEVSLGDGRKIYLDPDNWRADRDRCGGGLLIDGGFHSVYRQLFFLESLGAPRWLTADAAQIGVEAPQKGEDFASITLAYPSGARIHLMNAWTVPSGLGRFPSGIVGTEGALVFTGDPASPLLLRRPDEVDEPLLVAEGASGFAETAAANVEHYLECAATGREPWVGTDLAMLTLQIITGAYQAAGEGRRLELAGGFRTSFPGIGGG